MGSNSELNSYRQSMKDFSALVQGELSGFFQSLDLSKPDLVRDLLLEFLPVLISEYGPIGSELAVDWYMEQRAASGARAAFTPVAAGSAVADDDLIAQARFLAGKLWTPSPEDVLGGLLVVTDKYVKQPARDTLVLNARREGVRWARVPSGAKTCTWCLILASRDAAYVSRQSASQGSDGERYHGACDCQAVRIGADDEYPPGYLPDNYYDMYSTARDDSGSSSINDIAASMRRLYPEYVTDGVHAH